MDSGYAWAKEQLTKKKGGLSKFKKGNTDNLDEIVWVLANRGGKKSIPVLQAGLPIRKPPEWLSACIAVALLDLGDLSGADVARMALSNDKWLSTRLEAIEGLAANGDLSGLPVLDQLVADKQVQKGHPVSVGLTPAMKPALPAMTLIEDSAVDAVCGEVERVPPSRIPAEMGKAGRNQPELLAFLLGSTEGMAQGVSELTGFIYYVIWRTVCQETRGVLGPISSDAIQAALERKEKDLARLDDLDPALIDTTTFAQITRQPALFRYMLETIAATEESEPQPLAIPPEDKASVIILLSTAIDLLDEARSLALGKSRA